MDRDDAATVANNPDRSRFELSVGGEVVGFSNYERRGEALVFDHTVVDRAHGGRGHGKRLAKAVLDFAREERAEVLPYCWFVAQYIQDHPEYADLVPADRRDEFDLAG